MITISEEETLPLTLWLALVKYRAGHACEECGGTYRLAGHHVNNDPTDNRLANGQCLCNGCHSKVTHTGVERTAESKKRISDACKGRVITPEWRKKISEAHQRRKAA